MYIYLFQYHDDQLMTGISIIFMSYEPCQCHQLVRQLIICQYLNLLYVVLFLNGCYIAFGLDIILLMSHLTTSALEQHYLEAILPHPLPPQQHFLKNKDFYKP
jgi:hypothetical protein